LAQKIQHAFEGAGMAAQVVGVKLQEFFPHGTELRIFGAQAKPQGEQAAGAVGGLGADEFVFQRSQAMPDPLQIERVAEVGRGIDEGAVEVEEYGSDFCYGRILLDCFGMRFGPAAAMAIQKFESGVCHAGFDWTAASAAPPQ